MSASVRPAPPPAAFEPISRSNPDAPVRIDVAMPRGLYDRLTRYDRAPRSRYDVATGRAEYVAEPAIAHPGEPLVDTERFLDSPPASRNEALASLLRRFDICDRARQRHRQGGGAGRGPPASGAALRGAARLHPRRPLRPQADGRHGPGRAGAGLLPARLPEVRDAGLPDQRASLRERFGITTNNKAMVSRRIREAVDAGAIRPFDEHAAPKLRKYVPHWAGVSAGGYS